MRRFMGRNGFLLLTAIPVVVIAALLIRSYRVYDSLAWSWTAEHHLESNHGRLKHYSDLSVMKSPGKPVKYFAPQWYFDPVLQVRTPDSHPFPAWPVWAHESQRNWGGSIPSVPWYGFRYDTALDLGSIGRHEELTCLAVEYWLPLLLSLILPGIIITRRIYLRIGHRPQTGICPICQYDLRAHQPGQRCPECGHPVPPAIHQPLHATE